jgi:TolB-like protein
MADNRVQRRLAAIVATDIVGYSAMMERDEAGTLARLMALRADLLHPKVAEYGGRVVKTTGDGALIEFPSAVDAVQHAVEVQRELAEKNATLAESDRILLRIGINVGDIVIEDDDIYGDGVNIAARLEGLCGTGEVCVSAAVFEQVSGKLESAFDDLGEQVLKNISRPVRAYRVRSTDQGASLPSAREHTGKPQAPETSDKPSIAVLPFDSYSADAEQETFANGMTEDLTTDLSKVAGLFVVARNSAQAVKANMSDLGQIAQALGVRYVLEGSVRKAGARVRINAQLIEAATGGHLWADRFDGTIDDVFELQDDVSAHVVEALSVELSQSEKKSLGTVHTDNLAAYELFVRAKAAPYPPVPPRIQAAREMFESVIEMAPEFAGGYAGAAAMTGFAALWSHQDPSGPAARAQELARHAIQLDETFAWSYTALGLGLVLERKYDEAVAAARETIARQPSDADGYAFLGLIMSISGQAHDSADLIEEAIRLNPRFYTGPYWNVLGQARSLAGEHAQAIEALETNLRHQGPVGPPALCSRAASYAASGDLDKARAIAGELKNGFPQFRMSDWVYLSLVRPDETRNRYHDLLTTAGIPE